MPDEILMEVRFEQDPERQGPGLLTGTLMVYGSKASDRQEMFMPDSLHFPEKGIVIDEQHNRQAPIMRVQPVLSGKTLSVSGRLPDTTRGRDAATNIREGVLTGLSVTFHAEREERRGGVRRILKAFCPRAGLVDTGSYSQALVEVRAKVWQLDREDLLRWL